MTEKSIADRIYQILRQEDVLGNPDFPSMGSDYWHLLQATSGYLTKEEAAYMRTPAPHPLNDIIGVAKLYIIARLAGRPEECEYAELVERFTSAMDAFRNVPAKRDFPGTLELPDYTDKAHAFAAGIDALAEKIVAEHAAEATPDSAAKVEKAAAYKTKRPSKS